MRSASQREEIELTIDGCRVTAARRETLLQVARRYGIEIPTLCHHDELEPAGVCRVCLVEDVGRGKLVTACNYPVDEGMEIRTSSETVLRNRRTTLESLLGRCPEVPAVRELAERHGVTASRFPAGERDETCILCGLCTRACETYATSAIAMLGRSTDKRVGTFGGEPPDDCVGCCACEMVCPTGHIRSEREAGSIRIWEHALELATCVVDEDRCRGCGVCEQACPFSVPRVVLHRGGSMTAEIDIEACRGCGVCQAACPSGAISSPRAERAIPAAESGEQRLLVFGCGRSAPGRHTPPLPDRARFLELPCSGGVSAAMLLGALAAGWDGALVLGRNEATCRLGGAEAHARETVDHTEKLARLLGLGRDRLRFVDPEPGTEGPTRAMELMLGDLSASPLSQRYPLDKLDDTADGALAVASWLSGREELEIDGAAWLEENDLPAARPGEPALLANAAPYLDLLAGGWLWPLKLADQLRHGLRVLRQLGVEAGVAVNGLGAGWSGVARRYPGSRLFGLCSGCTADANEAGLEVTSLNDLLADEGARLAAGRSFSLLALGGDPVLERLAAALGAPSVDVGPAPPLGLKLGVGPNDRERLEARLVRSASEGAGALLVNGPAELTQCALLLREGAWRRSAVRAVLACEVLAEAEAESGQSEAGR
ncbi:MAG: 2Fe-2S iron-sulfur cluster-binding protein [Polyangia bacterium]